MKAKLLRKRTGFPRSESSPQNSYTSAYENRASPRMLRAGARFSSKFSGCPAQERDSSRFSGCSARERDFLQNFQDAPHRSAIFFKIFRMLGTGARFSSRFSGRSARERDFRQNKTTLSVAFWYRIGIETLDIIVHK